MFNMSKVSEKKQIDYLLLFLFVLMLVWGIFTVSTASFPLSMKNFGHPWYYFWHQLAMIGLGLAVFFVFFLLKAETLQKIAFALFCANLAAMLLVFVPGLGIGLQGSHRWINFGFTLIQPSEFLKITFPLYLAAWLSSRLQAKKNGRKKEKGSWVFLLPFAIVIMILLAILMFQPDMSTMVIIALIGGAMYFLSGMPLWHILPLFAGGVAAVAIFIMQAPYRLQRLATFLNPEANLSSSGYQVKQSIVGIGSGRIIGIGSGLAFGLSRQKFGLLPHSTSDSIFAIIGEELGFVGAVVLILLFILFAWRGFQLAGRLENDFQRILCYGIVFWITFQAFFNIGGIIGILPLGGVPLPFFSYGGSHIIAEMAGMGILLNLSKVIK